MENDNFTVKWKPSQINNIKGKLIGQKEKNLE